MSSVIIASSKEEKEKLLNIKIEQIKKKNEELLNKHKLIEEDKRLAELQGRAIKNLKQSGCDDGNVIDKGKCARVKKEGFEDAKPSLQVKKLPLEPAYSFLFDKMRDGPQKEDRRERTRRHPRNYGGINFEDVPRKIQQERAKQNNNRRHCRLNEVDYSLITTGKERREMDEWRKEREEIDKKRMQRQMKEGGGWKREWDQNKESSFVENDNSPGIRSSSSDQKCCAKMWTSGGSHRHYNKIYHQKRRVRRNTSDPNSISSILQGRNDDSKCSQSFSKGESPAISDSNEHPHCSTQSSSENLSRKHKHVNGQQANGCWRSKRVGAESHQWRKNARTDLSPLSPSKDESEKNTFFSSPKSSRKSVRFLDVTGIKDSQKNWEASMEIPQPIFVRTGRNIIGSGRFSGGQKLKVKSNRQRREFNTKSSDSKYGSQIRKVYLDEALCKSVEGVINHQDPSSKGHAPANKEVKNLPSVRSHNSIDFVGSVKPDELEKKSDDEYDDEDEQWEDIDEEVCLELDHGREELNIDASSESLDQFIVNNTLTLDVPEPLSDNIGALETQSKFGGMLDGGDASMGPQGGYPNILDWEDDAESISQLSDVEKCNASDTSVESSVQSCNSMEDNTHIKTEKAAEVVEDGTEKLEKAMLACEMKNDIEVPLVGVDAVESLNKVEVRADINYIIEAADSQINGVVG